jgi:hypothetical protein
VDPELINGRDLSGKLVLANDVSLPDESWTKKQKQDHFKDHKFDIRINTTQEFTDLSAGVSEEVVMANSAKTVLSNESITQVRVTSINMDKATSGAVIALIIVAGVLITVGLIILGVVASINASDSGVTSNSGSGDSGSGDSGSGASGDSSGS